MLFIQLSARILEWIDACERSFCFASIIRNASAFGFRCEVHIVGDLRFCELLPRTPTLLCLCKFLLISQANFIAPDWITGLSLHIDGNFVAHSVHRQNIWPLIYVYHRYDFSRTLRINHVCDAKVMPGFLDAALSAQTNSFSLLKDRGRISLSEPLILINAANKQQLCVSFCGLSLGYEWRVLCTRFQAKNKINSFVTLHLAQMGFCRYSFALRYRKAFNLFATNLLLYVI